MDYGRQIEDLQELAKQRGYIVVKVFMEKISSTKTKQAQRPELQKAIKFIKEENIDKLLMWEISRLDRSFLAALQLIEELNTIGVSTLIYKPTVIETLDEKGNKNPLTALMFIFLAYSAQQETETSTLRIKSQLRSNAKKNKAGGGVLIAYGYERDADGYIAKQPEEAEIVEMIFKWCLQGYGTGVIADKLNEMKVPTRTQKLQGKKNKEGKEYRIKPGLWAGNTVLSILKRTDYFGMRNFTDLKELKCPHIITKEIWEKAQQQLKLNYNENSRNTKHFYILKGLLKCERCGRNYMGKKRSDGTENYYQCSSRIKGFVTCGNKGIGIIDLNTVIWRYVKYTNLSKDYVKNVLFKIKPEDTSSLNENLSSLKKSINEEKKKINSIIKLQIEEIGYGFVAAKSQISKIEKKIKTLEAKFNKTSLSLYAIEQKEEKQKKIAFSLSLIDTLDDSENIVSEVLHVVIEKVLIDNITAPGECRITVFMKNDVTPYKLTIYKKEKIFKHGHEFAYPPEGFDYSQKLLK